MTTHSKRQFVETLQDGDVIDDYFVAIRKDLRDQQNGGKFLGMVFKDRTGEVGGILWNNAESIASQFELGDVVSVRGTVSTYQERLQIRVQRVLPLREGEYNLADLVHIPDDVADTFAQFRAILESVQNEWLVKLIHAFLDDHSFADRFCAAAAGKRWHHAGHGGLVQHCLEMARLAVTACDVFPEIDRDVLLTAILLHDIGKLDELTRGLFVEYTTAGRLLGHLTMGAEIVDKAIAAIDGFPDALRLQLLHCILAHHGSQENGSPVVPKTLEALVLFHIDNLGAQVNAFARLVDETREKGRAWSDYIQLIDRQVWTKEM
ncbi:MAG: HD domain-containing protein [Candidatus Hydrogenedentes bacterium]|nr:HD domain-containing protein [Candidatus Hydrogenedentota bacterium]